MSWQKRLCGFALAFDRLAKARASISTHSLRTASLKFPARCRRAPCCSSSLRTYSIHEKFRPTSSILISTPHLPCKCSFESNLSGQMIVHLVVKYTHVMSLALQIVRTRQCASSSCTVRLQLFSRILQQ